MSTQNMNANMSGNMPAGADCTEPVDDGGDHGYSYRRAWSAGDDPALQGQIPHTT